MKRGKKLARNLKDRLAGWASVTSSDKAKAYRKPGAKPGDFLQRYGAI